MAARKALLGVSIPRSGHHYLQRILEHYFQDQVYYCEWYTPKDCCRTVPCSKGLDKRVTYQKSHDWDFSLDPSYGAGLYVIQFRHPVPEAMSDRSLAMRDRLDGSSMGYRRTVESYSWWLAHKAIYYRKFHDKWFKNARENFLLVDYDQLLANPQDALRHIVTWVDGQIDPGRVDKAIADANSAKSFSPRVLQDSPYYDEPLLRAFEAYVLERCTLFGFESVFSGSYSGHELYGLILAQDMEEPLPHGETDRLDAAAKLAPNHPEIMLQLADREVRQGRPDRAIQMIDELLIRNPFFGAGYRRLVQLCKSLEKKLPTHVTNALFACASHVNVLIAIGDALLKEKRTVDAIALLAATTALYPDSARAHFLTGSALAQDGRWAQASPYVRRAAELQPDHPATHALLRKILAH